MGPQSFYRVVTDQRRVRSLNEQLRATLRKGSGREVYPDHWVGFPGGRAQWKVYALRRWGFYAAFDTGTNRWWNGFGLTMPGEQNTLPLIVEINVPFAGVNRSVGAVFLEDPRTGRHLIAHRGKIGGGRKGVSQTAFRDHFRGEWITAVDDDRSAELVPIAEVGGRDLPARIGEFVREVARIKELVTTRSAALAGGVEFTPEFEGTRRARTIDPITAQVTHGTVVRALAKALKAQGLTVANDRARDLHVARGRRARWLFEVKTDVTPSSVYAAIGQLLVHGRAADAETGLFLVAPSPPTKRFAATLASLGISVITYDWIGQVLTFARLPTPEA